MLNMLESQNLPKPPNVRRIGLLRRIARARWSYFFVAPAALSFIVFGVFPILYGLALSFTDTQLIGPPAAWVGGVNYLDALRAPQFYSALINTLAFTVMTGGGAAITGLTVALILNQITRGATFFRTALYIPVVTPIVAVTRIWKFIYNPSEQGLLNGALSLFKINPVNWLGDPNLALISLSVMTVWQGTGFDMVIFLAGLKGIPRVFYEAALIDGASPFQMFWHITLPLLRPVTAFVLVLAGINGLRAFSPMYLLPGPLDSTLTVGLYVFKNAFEYFKMGYAAAVGVLLTLLIVTLTGTQFWFFERKGSVSYE